MTLPARAPDVSVVVPVLNERGTLVALTDQVLAACRSCGRTVELLIVDDGSTDGSWPTILALVGAHPEVRGFRLRRSFGKAAALSMGFEVARGAIVVTMDGDLQDDPSELPRFFEALEGDLDAVSGWKRDRQDPLGKRLPSKFFNFVLRHVSGLRLHDFNCGFKAYTADAAQALRPYVYGDMHRYLPAILGAQGYRVGEIDVRHHARQYGHSKYGVGRILAGGLDLLTLLILTKYRYRPMHAFGTAALIVLLLTAISSVGFLGFGHQLFAIAAAVIGLLIVVTLFGVGLVSELAIHGLGPGPGERRVSARGEHPGPHAATGPGTPSELVDEALTEIANGTVAVHQHRRPVREGPSPSGFPAQERV